MSQQSSRRYGYYKCYCGRTWRSAYTWCYYRTKKPNHAQDCSNCHQAIFAYRIENLLVPDTHECRNDDLTKNHIQELCHRCRNKPNPCSSNNYIITNHNDIYDHFNDDEDDEDDEDDDLCIAIRNSLLHNDHNHNNTNDSQHETDNILDLCSDDRIDSDSDYNHGDDPIIPIDNNEYEYTQYSEAQSAVELVFNNTDTQTQPQIPHIICKRTDKNNTNSMLKCRKRTRDQGESENVEQYQWSPLHKKRRISTNCYTNTVQTICTKHGWYQISGTNMISFKKANQRLNVWVKSGGLLSMRVQPMECCRKNISLEMFEKILSGINININSTDVDDTKQTQSTQTKGFIITQEMRERMEANRLAALERKRKNQETLSQLTAELKLTTEQKQKIEIKKQQALQRRAAWRAKEQSQINT